MSIGYKKISEMISREVEAIESLTEKQKQKFKFLCNKIYMLEASTDSVTNSRMIEDIVGEISFAADRIKEVGD